MPFCFLYLGGKPLVCLLIEGFEIRDLDDDGEVVFTHIFAGSGCDGHEASNGHSISQSLVHLVDCLLLSAEREHHLRTSLG